MDFFLAPFLFSEIAAPATDGVRRSRRELEGDPHPPPVGQFFLWSLLLVADRTRPPAPLSNGVNVDNTRLETSALTALAVPLVFGIRSPPAWH